MEVVIFIGAIVVFLLLSALCYYVRYRIEISNDSTYVYPKNEHHYVYYFNCKMKNPTTGEWIEAVIYQGVEDNNWYVREKNDFFDKFVKLSDWKDEEVEEN